MVNGKDLDTGIYEYFPYADKAITDFRETRRIIKGLKEGTISESGQDHIYAKFCVANEDTNRRAIESSRSAFEKFRKFSLAARKKILLDMHKLLLKKKEEFINLLIIEGHPRKLAEWEFEGMNIGSSPKTIEFYCRQLQKEIGKCDGEVMYLVRKPDGVVCLNPPGNAAASNSYNGILVFLTGNTIIVRPPSHTPLSTIFLWKEIVNEALVRNNAPSGTLNIILGNSQAVMNEWLESPYVNDIIHFGDSKRGIPIGTKIYESGKKPILELSGNDFLAVWKDADIDKATDSLLDCFLGSTQICMVPKIALVHANIYDAFIKKMQKKAGDLKIGLPSDPETILSPVARMLEFTEFLKDAEKNGGELICGGQRINHFGEEGKGGMYIRPALLRLDYNDKIKDLKILKEEIFFPLLPIIKISGDDERISERMEGLINSHAFGLRVSLWITSPRFLRKFAKQLDNCGLLRINVRHVGFSTYLSTHGGTKKSGGPFGEMNYFWQKTSHLQGITVALSGNKTKKIV